MRNVLEGMQEANRSARSWRHPAVLAACCSVATWSASAHAQTVPTDPKPTCVVTAPTFAGWFASGKPTLNGVVNPANSVTFPNSGNCSFYQWSEQMFLWMTSPAPPTYGGGGGRIFDSPTFYDVSPPDSGGNRKFIAHTPGVPRDFTVRAAQVGPHGLPVVLSKAGTLLEVEPTPAKATLQVRDPAGKLVPVQHIKLDKGTRTLLDTAGKSINFTAAVVPKLAPSPGPRAAKTPGLTVRRFVVDKVPIFVDPENHVIETEEGQAGGGDVLMAQGNKLIYYVTMSNDVYAYFVTGVKNGAIKPGTSFPTTAADLAQVVAYAKAHNNTTFPDPDALAIEVKSSWIDATGLANLSGYITMTATVPTYNTTSSSTWTQNGRHKITLAMVGVHVVGSTAGHPEMIWATFEHVNNTPDAAYSYVNTANQTITVPQTTAGTWLFTANGAASPFNTAYMAYATPSPCPPLAICAVPANPVTHAPGTIAASNTLRLKPWGAALSSTPNPLVASAAASNSDIISINNSVRGQLLGGDVRGNYLMLGATWTIGGAAPNGSFSVSTANNEVGTSLLSNSTMETYQQGTTNDSSGTNCFTCHTTNTTTVSHVYSALQPLFK